jgi:hypothetical protein
MTDSYTTTGLTDDLTSSTGDTVVASLTVGAVRRA